MTTADFQQLLRNRANAGQPTPAQQTRRARRYTGRVAQHKAWIAEQRNKPGVFLELRTHNPLNSRRHWAPVARAAREIRQAVRLAMTGYFSQSGPALFKTGVAITMTRYGPGRGMDRGCGLNASMKPVRDGVADALGVDDEDARLTWVYEKEKAPHFGVRIEIERREP